MLIFRYFLDHLAVTKPVTKLNTKGDADFHTFLGNLVVPPEPLYFFKPKITVKVRYFLEGYRNMTFQKWYLAPLKRSREEVRTVFRFYTLK